MASEADIIKGFFQKDKDDKVKRYRHLNKYAKKGQILFTGSSLMEQFPINEILQTRGLDKTIYNRGIGGYTMPEMLEAANEQIFDLEPSKIFINIGTNDISIPDESIEKFTSDYERILDLIKEKLPNATVYMMAYYPINEKVASVQPWPGAADAARLRKERLSKANEIVHSLADKYGYNYIDVNDGLTDSSGQTKEEYSIDGIHMWSDAYEIIFNNIQKYL